MVSGSISFHEQSVQAALAAFWAKLRHQGPGGNLLRLSIRGIFDFKRWAPKMVWLVLVSAFDGCGPTKPIRFFRLEPCHLHETLWDRLLEAQNNCEVRHCK
jgi:hypothetical protein